MHPALSEKLGRGSFSRKALPCQADARSVCYQIIDKCNRAETYQMFISSRAVCVCVCVRVCLELRLGFTSGVRSSLCFAVVGAFPLASP